MSDAAAALSVELDVAPSLNADGAVPLKYKNSGVHLSSNKIISRNLHAVYPIQLMYYTDQQLTIIRGEMVFPVSHYRHEISSTASASQYRCFANTIFLTWQCTKLSQILGNIQQI